MLEAIRRKKARGLDMTVLLNPHEDNGAVNDNEDEEKDQTQDLQLAPEATEIGCEDDAHDETMGHLGSAEDNETPGEEIINHPGSPEDHALIASELAKAGMGRHSMAGRLHAAHQAAMDDGHGVHQATMGGGKEDLPEPGGHGAEGHGKQMPRGRVDEGRRPLSKRRV
jgi:hypothetical protein